MIALLTGELREKSPPTIVLDVQGVGYQVETSMTTFFDLPEVGQRLTLYTQAVYREDAHKLYGFLETHEKQLFNLLVKVNGVGPKIALGILSSARVPDLIRKIVNEDSIALSKLPGIGKKTAERLTIELRDKLADFDGGNNFVQEQDKVEVSAVKSKPEYGIKGDAVSALVSLGYRSPEAEKLIQKVFSPELSVEQLLKKVLQQTA